MGRHVSQGQLDSLTGMVREMIAGHRDRSGNRADERTIDDPWTDLNVASCATGIRSDRSVES